MFRVKGLGFRVKRVGFRGTRFMVSGSALSSYFGMCTGILSKIPDQLNT